MWEVWRLAGGFQEAFCCKPQTVTILKAIFINSEFFRRPGWRHFEFENRIFEVPRGFPRQSRILYRFWINFCTISGGLRTSKIRFSYIGGTNFEDFACCKMRCFFGHVLGGSWGGFLEVFGFRLVDFGGWKRSPNFKPKLKAEKVVPEA